MHPKSQTLLEVHIFMKKTGRKNRIYLPEFKIGVIIDMREHRMGYCETVRKYDLGSVRSGASIAMLQRWERVYLEEGAEGLMKERRGKAKNDTVK